MLEKIKSFASSGRNKIKQMFVSAIAAASASALSVAASAASTGEDVTTSDPVNMKTMLSEAGNTLISSFNDLVQTMIPVIMGIIGGGLVIFGLIALFKLAKKIFGKVAG